MSHRIEEKQARRAERLALEESSRRADARRRMVFRTGYGVVGLIAITLVTLSLTLGSRKPAATHAVSGGNDTAKVGSKAPDFTLTDAVSNKTIGLDSLAGHKTLLFFSEGVGCQACMVQVADLQKSKELSKSDIRLVSVSTDSTEDLAQAADEYGITTPMLADPSTEMSSAYGMLGHGGMGHPSQDGHAFILLDAAGKVVWHQAYQEMYVETDKLMTDIGKNA